MIAWILSTLLLGDISQGGEVARGSVSPAKTAATQVQEPVIEEDEVYFSDDEEGYMDEDFSDIDEDDEDESDPSSDE